MNLIVDLYTYFYVRLSYTTDRTLTFVYFSYRLTILKVFYLLEIDTPSIVNIKKSQICLTCILLFKSNPPNKKASVVLVPINRKGI